MKCPYCGSSFAGSPQYCPNCKQPLSRARAASTEPSAEAQPTERPRYTRLQRMLIGAACALCAALMIVGAYRLIYWASSYRLTRLYTRGEYTPTINAVTMDDHRQGHSVVFYGEDGDQIFLPELNESLSISGGVARTTIADADWFPSDVSQVERAEVMLSPVLIDETGSRTQLPNVELEIDVPDSPLEVISPAEEDERIVTSIYLLELQVVPGSTVLVNGEDVTDMVDRNGLLSQNVNIYPIGDNVFTIIVRTPRHHETRQEVHIYREAFDIALELDASVADTSSNEAMAISGTVEPGATLIVETPYVEDSLSVDPASGQFRFIARFTSFGENVVRFRASMAGREDAVISLTVDYEPTLAAYSAQAWAMDYEQLRRLYEQWHGQVFLCEGPIIDTVEEEGVTYLIMNVGSDAEPQLVVLENRSSVADVSLGRRYAAYADVSGRYMYQAEYYPLLITRYMDLSAQ